MCLEIAMVPAAKIYPGPFLWALCSLVVPGAAQVVHAPACWAMQVGVCTLLCWLLLSCLLSAAWFEQRQAGAELEKRKRES